MDSNPDQIIEILEETDPETDRRLKQFYDVLEEIKKRPDADRRLAQVETVLAAIAGVTDEEEEAARKLSEAFATIEEYSAYIPRDIYRNLADGLTDWIANSQWSSDPELMRQILPLLISKVIRNGAAS